MIFRREATQITNEGGLWDSAMEMYPQVGGRPFRAPKYGFSFKAGTKITFAHLNQESDVLSWQGAQIPLIGFDEVTHFSEAQFFYMLSRNRSACGVKPYVRATCNPDADSWVAKFIAWWIGEDGFPIRERSGVIRWMTRINGEVIWSDTRPAGDEGADWKSVTFIPSRISDNPALLRKDPGYLANLKALSRVDRGRLLDGNWRIRPAAGLYFPRHEVAILDVAPTDVVEKVRAWDLAATPVSEINTDPDATAGVLMGRRANGRFVILNVVRMQEPANRVRTSVTNIAGHDGTETRISIPQDPGQAGKEQAQSYTAMLAGYGVSVRRPSGDKVVRAEPLAAQWQAGNVEIMRGPWLEAFLDEMEGFPEALHDDQVDAAADALVMLANRLKTDIFIPEVGEQVAELLDRVVPGTRSAVDGTCGACSAYCEGMCSERGMRVGERDPGCVFWYN